MASLKPTSSRVEEVAKQLRESIFEGHYPPGTPLRELNLAKQMKVSQSTVREALRQLEHAGLVFREANRGSSVTRLSPKDIKERVTLRALLEVLTAQAAAERMEEAHFSELDRRLRILDSAVRSNSYYETAQADLDFHRYIWQCSGNDTICHVLELITIPLFAFISILLSQGFQRLTTVVEGHEPLITALRSRNPEKIRLAFEEGATHSYRKFLDDSSDRIMASAFGFLGMPASK